MKHLLFFLSILTIASACKSKSARLLENSFSKGQLQGNNYSNEFFGFKTVIDTSWHILNRKELNEIIGKRANMLRKTEGQEIKIADGAMILLSLATDNLQNIPYLMVTAFDLSKFPMLKSEKDYLDDFALQTRTIYQSYDAEISTSPIEREIIGGKHFSTILNTVKQQGYVAYQKAYSIKMGNYLLNIAAVYNSDESLKKCMAQLNNIKWK